MAKLEMNGSYELTNEEIDKRIKPKSIGNYALGYFKEDVFYVKYVGRSDENLNKRLKTWVESYKYFKYSYASSAKAAFVKECQNYHDFGEKETLDNIIHPDRPDGSDWKCPVCDTLG